MDAHACLQVVARFGEFGASQQSSGVMSCNSKKWPGKNPARVTTARIV